MNFFFNPFFMTPPLLRVAIGVHRMVWTALVFAPMAVALAVIAKEEANRHER